jgi:hypothetical protein
MHTFWLGLYFDWISACDEVWVFRQPGWNISYGVAQEVELAIEKLDKKVRYIDYKTYKFLGEEPKFYKVSKEVK